MDIGLRAFVLLIPCVLSLWAAAECQRRHRFRTPPREARVWAGLAGLFLLIAIARVVRELGYLRGLGDVLRWVARTHGMYDDRRMLQIVLSIAVVLASLSALIYGLVWAWHHVKRIRLAVGLAGLIVGYGVVRFISLHEVDTWSASTPWFGSLLDLVAAACVSTIALARLRQLTRSR